MKKSRKFMKAIGLASFLLIGLLVLSACNQNNDGGQEGNRNQNKPATTEGKVKLKVLANVNGLTIDLNEIPYLQELAEKTGVEIEWTQIRSGWDERKNPMLSTGDLPDIFIGALSEEDVATYNELFLPLDDLIAEHAPNVQKMFNEMPETKDIATTLDGHIYGLPSVVPHRPGSSVVPLINQTWLDQLKLEVPTTFEEFHNVLKAFKEQDPNGNNQADEIPFDWSPDQGNNSATALIGAYGNYALNFYGMNNVKDGQFVYLPETVDYRDLIIFMHQLYAEGLINKEVITQDWSQYDSRSKDPNVPIVGFTLGWSIDQRVGEVWAEDYVVMEPLAAEEGISPLWPSDPPGMKIQANKAQITTSSQNPEAAMKWLDGFYTEDISIQGYYGSFDVGIEQVDGKQYSVLDAPEGFTADTWKWTNALVDQGLMYISDDMENRFTPPPSIAERMEQDQLLAPYFQKAEDVIPKLKFTKEEADELSIINADLDKLVSLKWAEWISNGGIEQEWDSYVNELNKMDLARYKEINQTAYDRQTK